MVSQLLASEIQRNGVEILLTFDGVADMLDTFGIDLTATYTAPDWSTFDANAITAKDDILTIIKNLLVAQGVPATYSVVIEELVPEYASLIDDSLTIDIPVVDLLVKVAENVLHEYFMFSVEIPAALNAIRAAAPEAQVVVLGLDDALAAELSGVLGLVLDEAVYAEYLDMIIDVLNQHLFVYAAINTNTTYVENEADIMNAITVIGEDHDFVVTVVPATCTEDGLKTTTCTKCGLTTTEVIPATGHVYGDDNVCDVCGHDKTPAGPVTPGLPIGGVTVNKVAAFKDLQKIFAETPNIWWRKAVEYVINKDLMNGVSDTEFAPYATTTRAMLVTILWRQAGSPVVKGDMPFEDVESNTWYTEAVRWAAANGIVDGVSDTEFAPNVKITREQMVTIFYRYAQYKKVNVNKGDDATVTTFADVEEISSWAYEAMEWACGVKFVEGKENNNIDPTGNAIRAEVATLIMRFIEDVL